MPDDIFYPTGTNVCVMVWEAHKSHDSNKPTYFGYCKDDGFVKRKKMGRIDYYNRWNDIEKEWLDLYENKKVVDGKSALQCVTHEAEWLCEAYMKTNYKHISKENFENSVADHLSYLVKQKTANLEKMFELHEELELNFKKSAEENFAAIRAIHPWNQAYFFHNITPFSFFLRL